MKIIFILVALVMLGVIVFVHELGHFLIGRLMGIGVTEFSVGMGPKLFGWEKNGIQYSLRGIPLGGYCAFVGEDDETERPDAMNKQPAWKRLLTVAAGPFVNVLLALILSVFIISSGRIYNIYETTSVPQVVSLIDGMPARQAGLMEGDVIVSANGVEISYDEDGTERLRAMAESGQPLTLSLWRSGETVSATLVPVYSESDGRFLMGVNFPSFYAQYDCNVIEAIPEAFRFMGSTIRETVKLLGRLLGDITRGKPVEEGAVTGVVGVVSTVSTDLGESFSDAPSTGFFTIFYYIMAISLSIGITNLLPLPALDGGRLVFLIIETLTGKHLSRKTEAIVNFFGFVLLMALMLVVTYSDIRALIK